MLIVNIVGILLQILTFLLVARAILSWFIKPYSKYYKYYAILLRITEPVIYPFRKLAARFMSPGVPIDLAPLFAMLAIWLLQMLLNTVANWIFRFIWY